MTERWTLTLTEIAPNRDWFRFRTEGTVTGYDGEGRSDEEFVSTSGRLKIPPSAWLLLGDLGPESGIEQGYSFSWDVEDRFMETVSSGTEGTVVTLASGLRTGEHYVQLEASDGTNLPISELHFLTEGDVQWEPASPPIKRLYDQAFAIELIAYSSADQTTPVRVYQALPSQFQCMDLSQVSDAWSSGKPALLYGNDVSLAGTDRIFRSIRIPYFANYAQERGWSLEFYRMDGWGNTPGSLDYVASGDVHEGHGVIESQLDYNLMNEMADRYTIAVMFPGATNGRVACLLASYGPTVSNPAGWVSPWLRFAGETAWQQPPWVFPCWDEACREWDLSWKWRNGRSVLHAQSKGGMRMFRFESLDLSKPEAWSSSPEFVTDVSGALDWIPPTDTAAARFFRVVPTR